jgi:ribosomal 50S subunit-recycling heat shock protein
MRIDLFLKVSGILKTRSLADRACGAGAVTVDGRTAKSASRVFPGSVVTVVRPQGDTVAFRVDSVPESGSVSRARRASLYTVLGEDTDAD